MQKPGNQIASLTGIRFFLAFWVVLFHTLSAYGVRTALPGPLPNLVGSGYVAVGIFFVLSGFVLSINYNLDRPWPRPELVKFGIARFARIYPAYCVGLLIEVPIFLFGEHGLLRRLSLRAVAEETVIAAFSWTLLQAWVPSFALTWNGPGWSLSDEAFFYLCFPFIGVLLWRVSTRRSSIVIFVMLWAAAIAVPILATLGGAQVATGSQTNWVKFVKFNPLLRMAEFAAGILIARVYVRLKQAGHPMLGRGSLLYVLAILGMVAILMFSDRIPYLLLHNGLLLPLSATIVLGLAMGGGPFAGFLGHPILVFLGNASYSTYILHLALFEFMQGMAKQFLHRPFTSQTSMWAYLIGIYVLSALVYKGIEEPLNRILRNRMTAWIQAPALKAAAVAGSGKN